ncbi:MAG: 5'/3'-nucleotidase SurE [Bacteroidaceae bacterium]|nr:5'/3'-nucleotidase SurE [Bacteroidaceae bacterium]
MNTTTNTHNGERPLIFISNDDGVQAQGISELIRMMRPLGDLIVMAPDSVRSGAGCSLSPTVPVRATLLRQEPGLTIYSCSGTPTDCAKLGLERYMPRTPDLMVSGINHGDNSSVCVHYSGTMGAIIEGCIQGIPGIGYSLCTRSQHCDFAPYEQVVADVARKVLQHGLPQDVFLNVNFPEVPVLKGVRWCRTGRGKWVEEWADQKEPDTYRMTGYYVSLEPEAPDTDTWALANGFASVVPHTLDMTAYDYLASHF